MVAKENMPFRSKELQSHVESVAGLLPQAVEVASSLHEFKAKTFRVPFELGRTGRKTLFDSLSPGDGGNIIQLPEELFH